MSIPGATTLANGNGNGSALGPGYLTFKDRSYPGYHCARAMRLHRLFRHGSKLVIVPLDHSVTDGPGSRASMAEVTSACPIPVIVAGGSRMESAERVPGFVSDALLGGAAGVAIGRNIFLAADPRAMAGRVARERTRDDELPASMLTSDPPDHARQRAPGALTAQQAAAAPR